MMDTAEALRVSLRSQELRPHMNQLSAQKMESGKNSSQKYKIMSAVQL